MSALAQDAPPAAPQGGSGLTELTDEEMGDMRGRYTVSSNTVAWFGVTMVSTWQTQAGQQLKSSMTVTMDGRAPGKPTVTFQPHVSITAVDAPSPIPSGQREIDNAGLANVSGVVQSVQVAGDGNVAQNTAQITVREQQEAPASPPADSLALAAAPDASTPHAIAATSIATTSAAGMTATALLEDNAARVLLQIDGQGAVEQWVSHSGMGQTIQLAVDGHQASNWMELDLVRNSSQGRAALGQNVAQAISLSRGIAIGY
ncbi:hypothetical protein CSC65_01465 [Pseudoxanthomonas daejeonensis]|uniref:Uncharacterized protein n=2 Tax=Pseudoxanthomonas daejeonensis TaxID=266062 RepID=A0ABQ6ZC61_9GAMM|nr:hypothetical protein CSC65_01465 [Pseudoxanthomonas daejeonensis]